MRFAASVLLATSILGCGRPEDCVPARGTDPDYADSRFWACRPDVDDDACDIDLSAVEVLPDGSTQLVAHTPAPDPSVDCFYVYPTVDLRVRAGVHDDLEDTEDIYRTAGIQAARFSAVCRVFAPLYRQVTIGTYLALREDTQQACFDVAYADALAAFEHYLANDNGGRGFVLLGHSQGAQITSRLLRERIEPDAALHERLVVAAPIGWPVGVGGPSGGSFASTPPCSADDELGCAIGYRTYAEGNEFPTESDDMREGAASICVHPSPGAAGGATPLRGTFFPSDLDTASWPDTIRSQAPWVHYRDLYEAQCITEGDTTALRVRLRGDPGDVRDHPIDFGAAITAGATGTHIYDVQLTQGDLIALVGLKIAAYEAM